MANETTQDKLYLENLEEEVYQLSNVVTYKWLIRNLRVSANAAKRMLFEFVEKQKAAEVQLNVTYLVAGDKTTEQNVPIHEISIVPSSQLEATKARFSKITSLHVYAVHKAEIKDHSLLYATDYSPKYDAATDLKNGCAIRCSHVAFRPEKGTEIPKLSQSPQVNPPNEKKSEQSKEQSLKSVPVASNGKKTAKPKSRNKGSSLVGMFENMEKKKKDLNNDEHSKAMDDKPDPNIVEVDKELDETTTRGSTKSPKNSLQNLKQDKYTSIKTTKKEVREKRKAKTESTSKKRRRIIQISDSSSEEEEEEEESDKLHYESENPIPSPCESSNEEAVEEVVNNPERNSEGSGKKSVHKRKLVKESGMDEEGFLVTQNNWEDVSGSEESANENEDPIPKTKPEKQKKAEEPEEKKKVTPKSKQVMLTSFFKKK